MPFEGAYSSSYLMAVLLFALSIISLEIVAVEMCMILTVTMVQDQLNMRIIREIKVNVKAA